MHKRPLLVLGLMLVLAGAAAGCGDSDTPVFLTRDQAHDLAVRAALDEDGITALAPSATNESPEMVALGRMLFFDKELSGNRNISCATCHHPVAATGDALPVSIGEGGVGLAENRAQAAGHLIPRNAPAVFNLATPGADRMFWDGRVSIEAGTGILTTPEPGLNGVAIAAPWQPYVAQLKSALAAQAMFPVTSTEEMRGSGNDLAAASTNQEIWEAIMLRLVGTDADAGSGIAGYRTLFNAAFPGVAFDDLTFAHAARAIAAFEAAAYTKLDSPLDQYLAGDSSALSDSERRGAELFCGKAGCASCHNGPHLSDFGFHAIAAPQVGPGKHGPGEDLGLSPETSDAGDVYKFRTPPLRNVALTGPWTHAGAYTSLEAVVRHHLDPAQGLLNYDPAQLPTLFQPTVDTTHNTARLSALSPHLTAVTLTDDEMGDLMAFLHAMTSPSSLTLIQDVPDSVPSGLPVAD